MVLDPSDSDRRRLLTSIINAGNDRDVSAESALVLIATTDRRSEIRRSAMVSLRKLRSERLWPIIHDTLAHSDNENLIETAIKAVGELGDEATESLLATIHEAGKRTRFGVQAAHKAERRLREPQQCQQRNVPVARDKRKHLFVCHSSEDKRLIVEPIVAECGRQSVACWYDSAEILPGDPIAGSINKGLAVSRYVLAVLSPSFLGRNWPERELNAVISLEVSKGIVVLIALLVGDAPHRAEVLRRFPLLNDKLYIEWTGDPAAVVGAVKRRIDADCAW